MNSVLKGAVPLLLTAALMGACDGGSPTGDGGGEPTLALAVGSATASVEQAGTASIPVTVTRGGTFAGDVTIDVQNLPAGVTASALTIPSNATTGTVTLTADAGAAPGQATLTIRGQGSGVTAATASVALNITVKGSYTLASTPATLPVAAGGTGHADIAIERIGGFGGAVALTATAPNGITATLTSSSLNGTTASTGVDVAVASTVAPGSYAVTVQSATPGLPDQTLTIPITVAAPSTFTIAAPATMSVVQGASATGTVTITRGGAFNGAVALTATAPAGFTVTFNPASATGATSGVTVAAASTVTAGNYNIVVNGNANGLPQQTSTIVVTVTAPAVPAISMAVTPSPLAVAAGGSGTATLAVTRLGGFTGDVNLTADAAPAGITVTLNPTSLSTNVTGSTVGVTVASTVAAGSYNITLHGSGTGVSGQVVVLPVTVTAFPGAITVSTVPTSLSAAAGQQTTAAVTVTRTAPFTGAVALTADAPTGVTVTFAPTSLAQGVTASNATVAVASTVTAGSYNLTIHATGSGVAEATTSVPLTVLGPGGFSVTPVSAVTMSAGATSSAVLTITRTGSFTGPVTFTVDVPVTTGLTANVTPSSVTGTSTSFNVITTTSTPIGSYNIVVHANAAGLPEQSFTVQVTITAPVTQGGLVTWKFCDASGLPLWVAAQSTAGGTWERVTSSNNEYSFNVSGAGGIAYVLPVAGGGFDTNVVYGSVTELQERGIGACSNTSGAGKNITGTAAGVTSTDGAFLSLGRALTSITSAAPNFTLPNVAPGVRDLVGGLYHTTFDLTTFQPVLSPGKFILQRDIDVASTTSLGTVDFNNGITPASATATFSNTNGENVTLTSVLATNTTFGVYYTDFANTSTTRSWYGFPASSLRSTDVFGLIATANTTNDNSSSRGVLVGLNSVRNTNIAFGPALTPPTAAVVATSPYVRMKQTYTIQPNYNQYFDAGFSQGSGSTSRRTTMHSSVAYTGTTTAVLEIPDLSGVSGWDNNWGLKPGVLTSLGFTATGYTGAPPSASLTSQGFFDGLIYYSATKNLSSITP